MALASSFISPVSNGRQFDDFENSGSRARLRSMNDGMNKFFKTLMHPDQEDEEGDERAEVAKAANILQIGEFQLLQLAYHAWFDEDLPKVMVDKLFIDYMLRDEVPYWARQYARRILRDDPKGLINANDPAYHRYDHDYVTHVPQGVKRFTLAALLLFAIVAGGIWMSDRVAHQSGAVLPPYFDDKDLPKSKWRGKGVGPGS